MRYWVFPLPPPGDLTITVEWTGAHFAEVSVTLNASEARGAADRALCLYA
jgi:hypothetical protein